MNLLRGAASRVMTELNHTQNEATQLLSELDAVEIRLHRAFTAVSIDSCVAYLNVERNRMLTDEKRAETAAGLAKLPALGIHGLLSLLSKHRADWKSVVGCVFREDPFHDVRVMASSDEITMINVSGIARERGMTVNRVVAFLEQEGHGVLPWPEFVAEASRLRRAALRGSIQHLRIQ